MKRDPEGFLYPVVDEDLCISCAQCSSTCPVLASERKTPADCEQVFAAISKDHQARSRSSSGGIMSVLAQYVLEQNGAVYGAAYDDDFRVFHKRVDSLDQLDSIRRAKYAQSDLNDVFRQVQEDLKVRPVLFVGTPCQCAGLSSFLKRRGKVSSSQKSGMDLKQVDDRLILVDFVCHSIPSPKVWQEYVRHHSKSGQPSFINQRSKSTGWSRYAYSAEFGYPDGRVERTPGSSDLFMKLFIGDYITRKSCTNCHFKGNSRASDFTLGDFWGIWDLHPEMDDNQGTSLVVVHTGRGMDVLRQIESRVILLPVSLEEALKQNPAYSVVCHLPENRSRVMEMALNSNFEDLEREFNPVVREPGRLSRLKSAVLRMLKQK